MKERVITYITVTDSDAEKLSKMNFVERIKIIKSKVDGWTPLESLSSSAYHRLSLNEVKPGKYGVWTKLDYYGV